MRIKDLLYADFVNGLDPGVAEEMYYQFIEKREKILTFIEAVEQDLEDLKQAMKQESEESIEFEKLKEQKEDLKHMLIDYKTEIEYINAMVPLLKVKKDYLDEVRKQSPQVFTDNPDEVEINIENLGNDE